MITYNSVDSDFKKALRTQQTLSCCCLFFVLYFCFVFFFLLLFFWCSLRENHLDSHWWLEVKHFHFYSLYVICIKIYARVCYCLIRKVDTLATSTTVYHVLNGLKLFGTRVQICSGCWPWFRYGIICITIPFTSKRDEQFFIPLLTLPTLFGRYAKLSQKSMQMKKSKAGSLYNSNQNLERHWL